MVRPTQFNPLSRGSVPAPCYVSEGNTDRRDNASAWMALRGLRPWQVGRLLAREPRDLLLGRCHGSLAKSAPAPEPKRQVDMGTDSSPRTGVLASSPNPSSLAERTLRRQIPKVGARCLKQRPPGSVREVLSNEHPYRDRASESASLSIEEHLASIVERRRSSAALSPQNESLLHE